MAVISATDSDSVADHCLDHKSVFKVADVVALPCLTSLDACKRREDAFRKNICPAPKPLTLLVLLRCLQRAG